MFTGYSRCGNFTWNGTLRELGSYSHGERVRPAMAASSNTGLEVLLSTLQSAGDIESTLSILNVLDELLSAGTDRRIHYMISKGGSEALLMALVSTARNFSPNYTLLLPLLHLLAKVGHRDRRIGMKAEEAEAVLLTLTLLKQNGKQARRAAACLWVLQVFCSSVTTATLLGENRGLDVVFRFISPHTTRHIRTVKAAIDALAALLCSKANVRSAVAKGFVSALLKLYEGWHNQDAQHEAVAVRRALLRCLRQATFFRAGREALVAHGGMGLLYETTQTCLASNELESLVEPAVQLMRKCHPKCPLPLPSALSAYTFPLPGTPARDPTLLDAGLGEEGDSDTENEEADGKEYDDDLETDLNKLQSKPKPDRPLEQLGQYVRLCPELHHDFQELDSSSEAEESSDEEVLLKNLGHRDGSDGGSSAGLSGSPSGSPVEHQTSTQDDRNSPGPEGGTSPDQEQQRHLEAKDFRSQALSGPRVRAGQQGSMVERLLEKHAACVPRHDPRLYTAAAALTKSIPRFSILAFPDFWGHRPPRGPEPMAGRRPKVQRKKVLEDVQRLLDPDDIINQEVFDLEDASPQCSAGSADSLRFFSKFECGNLRKAIQVRSHEYDLVLNADVNCSQHHQWFYFEVSGMAANVPYRFNIINCEKGNSQFNYGMQPVLFSVREALEGRPHWVRTGSEICYYRNHFCPSRQPRTSFYTLTFTVTFRHNEDVCYLAYHYPYTYSALKSHLQGLQRSVDPRKVFFRQQSLCDTLAGNPCPLVTITACPASRSWRDLHQLRNRPCIVLTARVHPGESNASWVMKGTLEFLCSDDSVAKILREAFIFKIVPMLNPDGVINGTHRCSLNGEDLNRQWMKPDPLLSPTIYHTKGFLYYLNSIGRTPLVFCDYHGHSRKKNVFLYGCSIKETLWQSGTHVSTASLKEDPGYRTIPKTLDKIAPAFSFNSCNYHVEKSREATARVVVWREMGVLRSYTMESTYNGCDQGIYKGMQMGTQEMEDMGLKFCQSLVSLRRNTTLYATETLINQAAILDLDDGILDHKSHTCFEDDEPPCVEEIEYLTDGCPEPSGNELDSDVNGNTSSAEEEEEEEEESSEISRGDQRRSSMKARLFPHLIDQGSLETLNIRRSSCNGMDLANGQYLS